MKKYLIFDLDGTLIDSKNILTNKIISEINKIDQEVGKKAKTFLNASQGMPLEEAITHLFEGKEINSKKFTKKIYKTFDKKLKEIHFLPGVVKKIKKLSKNYTLFLSTGNSTHFAKEILKYGKIKKYFSIIKGSSTIPKGRKHIDIFKDYSNDPYFTKHAVFIGDGDMDREYSTKYGIDFIHIGKLGYDKYEIKGVKKIDPILSSINHKEKPVKISQNIVYESTFKSLISKKYRVRDGSIHDYIVTTQGDSNNASTMILPLTKEGKVVYIKEYRFGIEDFVYGFPIGIHEAGLTEKENVIKELKEETGYHAKVTKYLGQTIVGNYNDTIIKYYLARNCIKGEQQLENSEYIEVFKTDLISFKNMVESGKINCPLSLSCWCLAQKNLEKYLNS